MSIVTGAPDGVVVIRPFVPSIRTIWQPRGTLDTVRGRAAPVKLSLHRPLIVRVLLPTLAKALLIIRSHGDTAFPGLSKDMLGLLDVTDTALYSYPSKLSFRVCQRFSTVSSSRASCRIAKKRVYVYSHTDCTGEQLLRYASPSFAIISCGRNNIYGHPADRVVELLADSGIIYARTDESGAVYLKKAENGLLVFENASKSTRWLIPETRQTPNTPQKQ